MLSTIHSNEHGIQLISISYKTQIFLAAQAQLQIENNWHKKLSSSQIRAKKTYANQSLSLLAEHFCVDLSK